MTVRILGVKCIKETDKAILCEIHNGRRAWVPQSQIDDDSEVYGEGHEGDLVVTDWFDERLVFV